MASDIFELKSADIVLRVKGEDYKLVDPPFAKKVTLLKEQQELETKSKTLSNIEYLEAIHELNIKTLKLHIPQIPIELVRGLGQRELGTILDKLMEIGQDHFGAKVERVEKN
jgi:hypothetical protein